MWSSLGVLAVLAAAVDLDPAKAMAADLDPTRVEMTCDSILRFAFPDLCELEVDRGTLLVRNLSLVYWRYRHKNASSDKTPVLMVHGGPGFNHRYMLPLKQQACRGRDVVFYDQVGTGESAQPPNVNTTAPWLLTVEYYNEEIKAIAKQFDWRKFHLFGSSWGTIVGQSYGLLQDPRLQSLVLLGPLSDVQLYSRSQWDQVQGNLGSLPLHVQDVLRKLEKLKAFDSALYEAQNQILTSFFSTRTIPVPDCFQTAGPISNTSTEIYVHMQGVSEFTVGGVLASMNLTPQLHKIKVPVLLIHGRYDTMRPPVIDVMYHHLPRSWRAMMPRSGHCSMIDDPRLANDVSGEFFDHIDADRLDGFSVPAEAQDPGNVPLTPISLFSSLPAAAPLAPGRQLDGVSLALGAASGCVVGLTVAGVLARASWWTSGRSRSMKRRLASSIDEEDF